MTAPTIGEETRFALLGAGTEIFLRDGFRVARVKDIAALAGVRLSAISYHFGGKEGLYLATLRHHAQLALVHAPVPSMATDVALELRFHEFVRAMVMRMLDPASPSRLPRLIVREAVNPTPALEVMFEQFIQPLANTLLGLLREAFGPSVSRDRLASAALSIVGQSIIYVVMRPLVQRIRPGLCANTAAVTELSEHIALFSWAGVQALLELEKTHEEQ